MEGCSQGFVVLWIGPLLCSDLRGRFETVVVLREFASTHIACTARIARDIQKLMVFGGAEHVGQCHGFVRNLDELHPFVRVVALRDPVKINGEA